MMNQIELVKLFKRLKKLLKKYEGPFEPKFDIEGRYDLWSFKNIEIAGRKKEEIYFAGLIIQSSYVGFYYMPVYSDTNLKNMLGAELMTTLKGKSCFHIKKLDTKLEKQIEKALREGYRLYKKRGWV